MELTNGTKHQLRGAMWTVLAGGILVFLGWGALELNTANRWDHEPAEELQNEQLKQLISDNATGKQSDLRSEQRILLKDLSKLKQKDKLTDMEHEYKLTLEQQLEMVEVQLPIKREVE